MKYKVIERVQISHSPIKCLLQEAPLFLFSGAINVDGSCNFADKLPESLTASVGALLAIHLCQHCWNNDGI